MSEDEKVYLFASATAHYSIKDRSTRSFRTYRKVRNLLNSSLNYCRSSSTIFQPIFFHYVALNLNLDSSESSLKIFDNYVPRAVEDSETRRQIFFFFDIEIIAQKIFVVLQLSKIKAL